MMESIGTEISRMAAVSEMGWAGLGLTGDVRRNPVEC